MNTDARISVSLPTHPKTKKLIRRAGAGAAWHLVCLYLWASQNKPDGDLEGMSDEDIEIAAGWEGEDGQFVAQLVSLRFLDGAENDYCIHDWAEHNPWAAGAKERSESAKWAALCRRYKEEGAAERMPEYAERMRIAAERKAKNPEKSTEVGQALEDEHATCTADSCAAHAGRSNPLCPVSVSVSDTDTASSSKSKPPLTPQGGKPQRTKKPAIELKTASEQASSESRDIVPETDPVFDYADKIGLPEEFLKLAWLVFADKFWTGKRQKDWAQTFRNYVKGNYLKLWYQDEKDGWLLTTAGKQAKLAHGGNPLREASQ